MLVQAAETISQRMSTPSDVEIPTLRAIDIAPFIHWLADKAVKPLLNLPAQTNARGPQTLRPTRNGTIAPISLQLVVANAAFRLSQVD